MYKAGEKKWFWVYKGPNLPFPVASQVHGRNFKQVEHFSRDGVVHRFLAELVQSYNTYDLESTVILTLHEEVGNHGMDQKLKLFENVSALLLNLLKRMIYLAS